MEAVLVISRFALFSAAMILVGTSLFLLEFEREKAPIPEIRRVLRQWHRPVLVSAAAISLVSSVMWLGIEAGLMGGSWSDAANLQTLDLVLFETRFGHVWVLTLAFTAILLLVLSTSRGRGPTTLWTVLIAGLSALLVATSSWTGHAVMHSGPAGIVHLSVQTIHVLAASAWLGSLPALGFVLCKARTERQAEWHNTARHILPCYSRMASLAVALILLTGCLSSWFMVDSIDALFGSAYGRILIAKIGLFVLMVGVAAVNRFVLTPAIVRPEPNGRSPEAAVWRLGRNVAMEQLLGLSVVAAVSVLGTIAPAMSTHMEM